MVAGLHCEYHFPRYYLSGRNAIAAHESSRTTKFYDWAADEITLDENVRIVI